MNKVELIGRLCRDVDIRYTQGAEPLAIARFTLAVNRRGVKKDAEQTADFISCVAFGKSAEFINKYFHKGNAIGVTGRIQTGSYTNKEGVKVYTTDVVVEEVEFVESKSATSSEPSVKPESSETPVPEAPADEDGFMDIPSNFDGELPFR